MLTFLHKIHTNTEKRRSIVFSILNIWTVKNLLKAKNENILKLCFEKQILPHSEWSGEDHLGFIGQFPQHGSIKLFLVLRKSEETFYH